MKMEKCVGILHSNYFGFISLFVHNFVFNRVTVQLNNELRRGNMFFSFKIRLFYLEVGSFGSALMVVWGWEHHIFVG